MNKLIALAFAGMMLFQTAQAADKYNFKDPAERKAVQQALSREYTKSNLERTIRNLERAVQNNSDYAPKAKAVLPALKDLYDQLELGN